MRKLVVSEFMTLDGVVEAPGGETSLGELGSWTMPFRGVDQEEFKYDELFASDTLLLGRKTYEGFAAVWPTMGGMGEFGKRMNSITKYVVTKTITRPVWSNTSPIRENALEKIRELKNMPGRDILVYGSADLVQSLLENDLIDELRLMVFPVVLGIGKKLFKNEGPHRFLKIIDSIRFSSGAIALIYGPSNS